jgi:hypothetical protein
MADKVIESTISDTDNLIINLWMEYGSVKMITKCTPYSRHKIIKCLATHNFILNSDHQKILELYESGMPVEHIAKQMGLCIGTVRAYLPRVRPEYGQCYSKNAKKLRAWKAKRANTVTEKAG